MAIDRKISDLDNIPGLATTPPKEGDYFLIAREDVNNYKLSYTRLDDLVRRDVVFTTGDQTIDGQKSFDKAIIGNLQGFSKYVYEGMYITGDQTVAGIKTFDEFILGNVSGNLSGTAQYVVSGVYQTGDQTIYGIKSFEDDIFISGKSLDSHIKYVISNATSDIREDVEGLKSSGVFITGNQYISGIKSFDSFISGNVSGNLSGTARYVQDGVYLTGNQVISGVKTFDDFLVGNVSGNLSGTSLYVKSGVYTSGDQKIEGTKDFVGDIYLSGKPIVSMVADAIDNVAYITGDQNISGIKTFESFISGNVSGNLSGTALYVQSGVYTSGNQNIEGVKDFVGDLYISGKPFTDYSTKLSEEEVLFITGYDQVITGKKIFYDYLIPSGGITTTGDSQSLVLKGDPYKIIDAPTGALTISFENGVYITGSDLHVQGKIFADEIQSVDSIAGNSGSMVLTDGRDPALFEGPDESLSMAFKSGVFITGGADLHVEGKIFADEIEALDSIAGESGAMVLTDGRDPALFEGPDESLSLAFKSGVYITGSSFYIDENLYISGKNFKSYIPEDIFYITGDQTVGGEKVFSNFITADISGNLSGTASNVVSGVYTSGNQQIKGIKDFVGDLLVSGKPFNSYASPSLNNNNQHVEPNVFYETINSNFWWSSSSSKVYIPLSNAETACSSNCTNSEESGKMNMQHVKLMPNKGKVKKINFSITKTNPHGIPNPQFNIISGKAIDYDCDSSVDSECSSKLYFIDDIGEEVKNKVGSTNFQYSQWEDTYHVYARMGSSYPSHSCCYPSSSFNPNTGWTPSEDYNSSDLKLWLDASDLTTAGATWNDKSGNENHATKYNTPTVVPDAQNGLSLMRYDRASAAASTDYHEWNDINDIRTIFAVFKRDSGNNGSILTDDSVYPFFSNGDSLLSNNHGDDNIKNGLYKLNGSSITPTSTEYPANLSIVAIRSLDTVESSRIGRDREANNYHFDGDYGELLIFNTALSDADIEKIEGYLAHKWGLEGELPNDHGWKSTPPSSVVSFNTSAIPVTPQKFRTPQKYITYSYELPEENHYEEGTYLAIEMDNGGTNGEKCYEGNINQAIFISVLIENKI
ncbi:MAG: hypothetical protein P8P37_02455 [Candidatus Marinimicrobia bacterium]|nr:hypothetical protein [Candidatus Neomarinimicrobiota bacterium]